MKIITEPKELIGRYVAQKQGQTEEWQNYSAIGLLNSNDELIAGVVFDGYQHPNILMHIAAERLSKNFMDAIVRYPFEQLQCKRITGTILKSNKKSRRFANHMGFKLEGILRDAHKNGDVCIYGLMKKDAKKWMRQELEKVHG
jgi:RimJ/RimL family protein N-acetyltransferase